MSTKTKAKKKGPLKKKSSRVAKKRSGSTKVRAKKRSTRKTKKSKQKNSPVRPIKIPAKIERFLAKKSAKYEVVGHRKVYTTYDAAMTLRIPVDSVAKTLLLKADNNLIIVVVPGGRNLDFSKLKKVLAKNFKERKLKSPKKVSLASEKMIEKKFMGSPGALPPFGELYGLMTFVDKKLLQVSPLIVNSGLFVASLRMTPKEFLRIVEGELGLFSKKR